MRRIYTMYYDSFAQCLRGIDCDINTDTYALPSTYLIILVNMWKEYICLHDGNRCTFVVCLMKAIHLGHCRLSSSSWYTLYTGWSCTHTKICVLNWEQSMSKRPKSLIKDRSVAKSLIFDLFCPYSTSPFHLLQMFLAMWNFVLL